MPRRMKWGGMIASRAELRFLNSYVKKWKKKMGEGEEGKKRREENNWGRNIRYEAPRSISFQQV